MFQKFLVSKTKIASEMLKKINISSGRAHLLTQLRNITGLFDKPLIKAPSPLSFIKAMKKEPFTLNYILKCSILLHFFLQKSGAEQTESLHSFVNFLMNQCREFDASSLGLTLTSNTLKTVTTSLPTESDEVSHGKETFMLKQIIYPYLCYLTKIAVIKEENSQNLCEENHEIWRLINLLKSISSFTTKFTIIGRYYMQQYGAIIILLSEILSIDINDYVNRVNSYLVKQFKMLCFCSSKEEEKREIDDVARLLEEMGFLNERFSQFYMGKYFFQYLQHIKSPEWLDNNSPQFDRVFSARNARKN